MQFLSVDFALNQKYYVDQEAFEQTIKKSLCDIPKIKINDIKITIDKYGEQISTIIDISLISKKKMSEIILKISANVSLAIENLINSKPQNIQIKVKGDSYE